MNFMKRCFICVQDNLSIRVDQVLRAMTVFSELSVFSGFVIKF